MSHFDPPQTGSPSNVRSSTASSGFRAYRAYGPWLRETFGGKRVFKVIADGGFTCPNRDGSKGRGGCSYCNVDSFTPPHARHLPTIREQILQGMERARKHYGAEKFVVYFQPNTNTYAPVEVLRQMFDEAVSACPEDTVGLSVGTRPDCLDDEKISLLESYTSRVHVDLELGMESMHDTTLDRINRQCSHAEWIRCVESLAHSRIHLAVHTILGFPWESREMMLQNADEISRFPQIRAVKLHHLHVVKGSIMAAQYRKQPFPLFTLDDYTDLLCEFLPRLRPDLVIQRLFGLADRDLLIAPIWDLSKASVQIFLERQFERRGVIQGSMYSQLKSDFS